MTPNSAVLAGTHGLGMLCVAATTVGGYDVLGTNWQIALDTAAQHGTTMDRGRLRLVGPVHLAETREQAIENVRFGLARLGRLLPLGQSGGAAGVVGGRPGRGDGRVGHGGDRYAGRRDRPARASCGERTGGFGCFLQLAHNWASWEDTRKSYELFARYVTPAFTGANRARAASLDHYRAHNQELVGQAIAATMTAINEGADKIQTAIKNRATRGGAGNGLLALVRRPWSWPATISMA